MQGYLEKEIHAPMARGRPSNHLDDEEESDQ
jgi:hypothetical protein